MAMTHEQKVDIGRKLKAARNEKKIDQMSLGLALGFKDCSARRSVQQWESGNLAVPLEHIRKLSELLEVPVDTFIP